MDLSCLCHNSGLHLKYVQLKRTKSKFRFILELYIVMFDKQLAMQALGYLGPIPILGCLRVILMLGYLKPIPILGCLRAILMLGYLKPIPILGCLRAILMLGYLRPIPILGCLRSIPILGCHCTLLETKLIRTVYKTLLNE